MEEQLCRIEIDKDAGREEYVARIYSQFDGEREFRHRDLDHLLRELTVELEFSFGEATRGGKVAEEPPNVDEEGGFIDEDKF